MLSTLLQLLPIIHHVLHALEFTNTVMGTKAKFFIKVGASLGLRLSLEKLCVPSAVGCVVSVHPQFQSIVYSLGPKSDFLVVNKHLFEFFSLAFFWHKQSLYEFWFDCFQFFSVSVETILLQGKKGIAAHALATNYCKFCWHCISEKVSASVFIFCGVWLSAFFCSHHSIP